jgi:hypothetical protein
MSEDARYPTMVVLHFVRDHTMLDAAFIGLLSDPEAAALESDLVDEGITPGVSVNVQHGPLAVGGAFSDRIIKTIHAQRRNGFDPMRISPDRVSFNK